MPDVSTPHVFTVELEDRQSRWFQRFRGEFMEQSKQTDTATRSEASFTIGAFDVFANARLSTHHHLGHQVWLRVADSREREVQLPSLSSGV